MNSYVISQPLKLWSYGGSEMHILCCCCCYVCEWIQYKDDV